VGFEVVLGALTVTFTPTDTADYEPV
jgi:hypothetical protein